MKRWEIFTRPGALMDRIRERPTLAVPIAVNAVVYLVVLAATWALLGQELFARAGLSPETFDSAALNNYRVQSALSTWIFFMGAALVKAFFINIQLPLHRVKRRMRAVLSVIAHAMYILLLGEIIMLPLRLWFGDPGFTLSAGQWMDPAAYPRAQPILAYLDLFTIWFQVAVIIGIHKVTALDWQKSALVVLVPVALLWGVMMAGV